MNASHRLVVLALPLLAAFIACSGGVNISSGPSATPGKTAAPPKAPAPQPQPSFTIATGLMDVWDTKTTGPTQLKVSPDGRYLLTLAMSSKENVQVWDLATRTKLHGVRCDIGTMHAHITIAPDSRTAAYQQLIPDHALFIFDLATGEKKLTIPDKYGDVLRSNSPWPSLQFSSDGKLLVFGGRKLVAWEAATGKVQWSREESAQSVSPFFDNGTRFATVSLGRVHIRNAADGGSVQSLDAGGCESLAVSPDGGTLIAGGRGRVKTWDLPAGRPGQDFQSQMGTFYHIVPLPGRHMAAWPTNNGFILCDLDAGAERQRVQTNEQPYVTGLAVTPDGSTLLTAATDGLIKGWQLNTAGLVE